MEAGNVERARKAMHANKASPEDNLMPLALKERHVAEISNEALATARDRYFPGWSMHLHRPTDDADDRPFYRIVCESPYEARLAELARPDFIEAEILIRQD
jgi:hypothetical protein